MAVEKIPWNSGKGFKFRVTYRNPLTKQLERRYFTAREHGTVEEAGLAARQFDLDIKRRIRHNPQSFSAEAPTAGITFTALAQAYYAAKLKAREIAQSTVRSDLYRCNSVIFPVIGHVEAESVTDEHLAGIVREYRDRGCRQNGINRAIAIVKAVYTWALADKRIKRNPARDFDCKRAQDEKTPPPTWDEFWNIHANAAPHIQRAMILSVALGVRVGESELLKLKKSETWLDLGLIRVWSAKKKQRIQYRDVDLMPWVVEYFQQWLKEDQEEKRVADTWISYRGKPITTLKHAWAAALGRAGITRKINPYALRHLHATEALDRGADIGALAVNMGTSPDVIRKHYQHVKRETRRAALAVMPELSAPQRGEHQGEQ